MPGNPFTEQYQWELLEETHKAFDFLIGKGMLAGEMIWNFADFMTDKCTSLFFEILKLSHVVFFLVELSSLFQCVSGSNLSSKLKPPEK